MSPTRPRSSSSSRPTPPDPARRSRRGPSSEELQSHRLERAAKNRRQIQIGLACIGGFAVVAAILVYSVWTAQQKQEAADAVLAAQRQALRHELLDEPPTTAEQAAARISRIEAKRFEWSDGPDADAIQRMQEQARQLVARATAVREAGEEAKKLEQLAAQPVQDAASWQVLLQRADALEHRAEAVGKEAAASNAAAVEKVREAAFDALVKEGSAQDLPPERAVAALAAAEDVAAAVLATPHLDAERHHAWQQRARALVAPFDAAEERAFAPATVAALPWQELKHPEAHWVLSSGSTIVRRLEGDTLALTNAAGKDAKKGMVVLRHDGWHACAIAFDLTLERGQVVVFPRARTQFNEKDGGGIAVATKAAGDAVVIAPGAEIHVELLAIGGKVTATFGAAEPVTAASTTKSEERCGAIAFLLHPDTALRIRQLRIRRLGRESHAG